MAKIFRFDNYREKIATALGNKQIKCSSCNAERLELMDGFVNEILREEISNEPILTMETGIEMAPEVMTICSNCGHVQKYSFEVLIPEAIFENNAITEEL